MTTENIVLAITLGIAIASVYVYYTKKFLGGIVLKLLEKDAFDEDSAVFLDEINLKINPFMRFSMREGTSFSNTVIKTENGRYYLPEDKIRKAEAQYQNNGITFLILVLTLCILFIVGFIVYKSVPTLESFFSDLFKI